MQGELQGDVHSFEHTTLVNLSADSPLLWAHVCLSFFFFPLAIIVMRRFSVGVRFQVGQRKTCIAEKNVDVLFFLSYDIFNLKFYFAVLVQSLFCMRFTAQFFNHFSRIIRWYYPSC